MVAVKDAMTITEIADRSAGLLPFIDNLADEGILTFPRLSKNGKLVSLRFGRSEEISVTAGRAGVSSRFTSSLYFSTSYHLSVLAHLAQERAAGRPQPRILDEAREVIVAHEEAATPGHASGIAFEIMKVNDEPERATRGGIFPVLDTLSHLGREDLVMLVQEAGKDEVLDLLGGHAGETRRRDAALGPAGLGPGACGALPENGHGEGGPGP